MALGPGIYDALCTYVREQSQAEGAIVIVLGGELGSGFSVQIAEEAAALNLPKLLREMAAEIETSFRPN
jgi:hypothetical protein